jgi:hypothetical protein
MIQDIKSVDDNKGSVEDQPSQTAMGVATARAVAAIDEREEIRGPDYLAEIFLPENIHASLKNPAIVKEIMTARMPGMYEYFFYSLIEKFQHFI